MLSTLKDFLADDEAKYMYITGAAGTGKTTSLSECVKHCIDNDISYIVCAFTHKACNILRSKLPTGAKVSTLHAYLTKMPTINQDAKNKLELHGTLQRKNGETVDVIFVDEYSMVGEDDSQALKDVQREAKLLKNKYTKVIYIGDKHQLPPVGEKCVIEPEGDYQVLLTKIWRNDNPLQKPLTQLIGFMNGNQPKALQPVKDYFERGRDLTKEYLACNESKVVLAYTNKAVELHNQLIEGKTEPEVGDVVFSPTTRATYTFKGYIEQPTSIQVHMGEELKLASKFKTLEHLIASDLCKFMILEKKDGTEVVHAVVFGHYQYKLTREEVESEAVEANRAIERRTKARNVTKWCAANSTNAMARRRAKAWRDCLSFKDCVMCIDFNHAMTVHKSQGSTYNTVFVDTDDIGQVSTRNWSMYLRLLYVAISRASNKVYTN